MSWIGFKTGFAPINALHGAPCPIFRKDFTCEKKVVSASLKITSLGVFKAYLNGKSFSDDFLAPGWTDYTKRIPYCEYDLTERIKENNKLEVIVADGWYTGRICWSLRERYGKYPLKLWAEITLTYEDGSVEKIETDKTWKASKSQTVYGDILCGEFRDLRIEPACDQPVEVLPDEYSHMMEPQKCPPVRLVEKLPVKKLSDTLWDTEQNFAGVVRFRLKGTPGAKIRFRYAELLGKDGKVYTENLRNARCTDYVILKGEGEETYEPCFTYHGFRYIEVCVEEGEAEVLEMTGLACHNDLTQVGSLKTDNALINQIYSNALWGLRSNFVATPTDCPQRDERLGWTADAQVFCPTAMYMYDCKGFYEKYMTDIRDAQRKDGGVINVAPYFNFLPITGVSAAWADAVTVIPYHHYLTYGDKKILQDNLPACKKWIAFCKKHSFFGIRPPVGFGDWLSIRNETNKGFIATAYYAYSARLVAEMCKIVGDEDEGYYRALSERIEKRMKKKYYKKGKIANDTQTAYTLACMFGFSAPAEVRDDLVRKIEENDGLLNTGFIGTRYLLPALSEIGRSDLAYKLLGETRFPSWGYTVGQGATTIWERWDGYRSELANPFQNAGMNSYNHYSFGACIGWVYEYALGIRHTLDAVGPNNYIIHPSFDVTGTIKELSGTYNGISASWKVQGKTAEYRIKVPDGVQCKFVFDDKIEKEYEENGEKVFILSLG